jgi:hypothetical protein
MKALKAKWASARLRQDSSEPEKREGETRTRQTTQGEKREGETRTGQTT